MKYIRLFEDMYQLPVRGFNDVVSELKNKLNFIGFDFSIINSKTNHDFYSDKDYTITFNFNLNGVENSLLSYFCPLIIKNSPDKNDQVSPLNSQINFTLNLNYDLLNTYKLFIKYDVDSYNMPSNTIKPRTDEEAYVSCMSKLLELIKIPDGGVKIKQKNNVIRDGRISSLLSLIRIFIKDNITNYKNYPTIIISDEFMGVINILTEYYIGGDIHGFINFVKTHHTELYAKIAEIHGKGADSSANMGEMGF